ncbi:MAG: SLBB domain-containing protein, partial [Gemmatimonadaceae bacterium]
LRPQAKTDLIFLERRQLDGSVKVIPLAWDDSVRAKAKVALQPLDRIQIFDKERYADVATLAVEGAVRNPVTRSLAFGASIELKDLLTLAGGLQPTAADTGYVVRTNLFNPKKVEYLPVNVRNDVAFLLGPGDRLIVYDRQTFTDVATLAVEGSVRNPVTRTLAFGEKLALQDAIALAGGLQPTAADAAFVIRTDLFNPKNVEYLRVNVRRDVTFPLGAGDRLMVYDRTTYTNVGQLSLSGSVKSPVRTEFDPALTVTDLVTMAGGFTRAASLNRVDVFRLNVSSSKGATFDRIPVKLDSLYRVISAPPGFRLRPFDQIVVRDIPMFDVSRSVQLSGQVMYPGTYALANHRVHLSDVVSQAGGLTELADPKFATLVRSAGGIGPVGLDLADALRHKHNLNLDPILLEGDVITVPQRSNLVTIRLRATRVGELASSGVVTGGITEGGTTSFSYEGDRAANWYLRQFAGGFAQKADRWSVTVTDPNGQVRGTERRLLFFKSYPTVHQGSTISLRYKFEVPPEQKRKIDYDAIYTRTFQVLTTVLSLIVLSRQL